MCIIINLKLYMKLNYKKINVLCAVQNKPKVIIIFALQIITVGYHITHMC
jgi:hypothetical protein